MRPMKNVFSTNAGDRLLTVLDVDHILQFGQIICNCMIVLKKVFSAYWFFVIVPHSAQKLE
jgi:hypothetical protein